MYRIKFNEMSKKYITQLLDLILDTPEMPEYYKEITRDSYAGIQNYMRLKG